MSTTKTLSQQKNTWMRRALIFDKVLRYSGLSTANIMQCGGETLVNILLKAPENIIRDCQMRDESERLPKMGDKSLCKSCGKPIEYIGPYWRHTTCSPRHIAIPA